MYLAILVAFLSVGDFLPGEGCTCMSRHLQNTFCSPYTFALKVKFLSATYTAMSRDNYNYTVITYTIDLLQVFKGSSDFQNLKYIYTSTEYYCDFDVKPSNFNEELLVTGYGSNGRVELTHCDTGIPWSQLTQFKLKGIQGAYSKGCDCNIFSCKTEDCSQAATDGCTFREDHPHDTISPAPEEDKMCARNKNGICVWQPVGQF